MKEGFDKEIDSLLRRRARGTTESRSWGVGAGDGAHNVHLDADELGAFAEGALPAAARLAAASHLADCERCRGVVVGLARVAGFEVKPQAFAVVASAEPARPSAWRAFVASLFAPRVLRYAAPVLALSLVAVVSYVALRSNNSAGLRAAREGRRQTDVAMTEPSAPAAAANAANANAPGLVEQSSNAATREAQGAGAPSAQTRGHGGAEAPPTEADTAREDARPSAASPPPPPVAAEAPAELGKAASKAVSPEEGEAARVENKEKSESRDKSARGAEPVDDVASNDTVVQRSRAAQSRAVNEVQMPDGGARNQSKRAADNNAAGGFGNVAGSGATATPKESERERPAPRAEAPGRTRAVRRAEQKTDEDERDGQTRTAAGHRFRREGSAWVDVNYKPSMPSTGVRRGTEAFRALVADVPEVGRVAEAIGGEVVIVVSGRAYRIR